MARVMAFDVGRKRVGIAVTDPLQIIANGLTTLQVHEVLPFLKEYLLKEEVELFVVGYARQSNGEDSESMNQIRPFVNSLKNKFPQIPVKWIDERYTSQLAFQAMIDGGMKKMARRDKAMIDKISATIILQSYLDGGR
ncbi:Holliday junction resolvase RuvX [Alkalitalea saponilacus]|uniref:Putative pre-16S rRNA nuclease n=1 Tax=Alkalitalea saponilacus TaxID=889453 RepID=A0A1T5HSR2_9BACT|nr:Holliday junction resolvase RuvX [Alkalitalea saponilacus]ASB48326.1 Holliday junction resolvase RuvX [Alkalitalea saponilacus]SKC23550.1 putative holliday junction resolvase [Alkalitalea saponilacus]